MAKKKQQTRALVGTEMSIIKPSTDSLIALALNKEGTIQMDVLDKLIALKNAEEDRRAKQSFEMNFSLAQAEFPSIKKTKAARDSDGTLLYAYCPLENIILAHGPILTRHGFSWTWDEKAGEGKKLVKCFLSGYGYTKTAEIELPILPATKFANAIQQSATTTSYGRRYTFISVVGVVIAGEDLDGNASGDGKPDSPRKETKEFKEARAALHDAFERLSKSKLFGDKELAAFKTAGKNITDAGDVTQIYALKVAWDKELDKKKRGEK